MITCPECGVEFERTLKVKVSTPDDGTIRVLVTDTAGDPALEERTARAVAKLIESSGDALGIKLKTGKVEFTDECA